MRPYSSAIDGVTKLFDRASACCQQVLEYSILGMTTQYLMCANPNTLTPLAPNNKAFYTCFINLELL